MKFTLYVIAAILTFTVSMVSAKCSCSPADTDCLNSCVVRTNKCITDCQSNSCYTHCIRDHWPGGTKPNKSSWDAATPTKPSNSNNNNANNQPGSPTSSILVGPGPTSAHGQPVPSNNPSGTAGHNPSSVGPNPPGSTNASDSSYNYISKVIVAFSVGFAVYFLQ